jgi:hypothetical protein
MAARVTLLGWGSLLWEGGGVFDAWHDPWQSDGPFLRLEFSRVSRSRGGGLTLVIDPENGVPVRVAWCMSRRQTIAEAIEDLRQREQTPNRQSIGWYVIGGEGHCHDPESLAAIRAWASERELNGVVWTDLQSNFAAKVGKPFSVDAAMRYLKNLRRDAREKAVEYIRRAPPFVRTPVRVAFDDTFAPAHLA